MSDKRRKDTNSYNYKNSDFDYNGPCPKTKSMKK